MSVRIVTDSTCDLPAETIARYGIYVIPLSINIGEKRYVDCVDISRAEFYKQLMNFPEHATTTVPSIESFYAAYKTLVEEEASEILSIHIAKSLSAVVDVACLAAQEILPVPIHVIDSQQLSLGTGFLVETAARMAAAGNTAAEIRVVLDAQIKHSYVFAALDTLEFLERSGRMNKYLAGFALLFQIKPIFTMYQGRPGTERVSTRARAMKSLTEMLATVSPLERIAIVHTHTSPGRIAELHALAAHLLPKGELLTVDITPVIGAHIGPDALGFAVVSGRQ